MADSVQWLSQSDYSICISVPVEFYKYLLVQPLIVIFSLTGKWSTQKKLQYYNLNFLFDDGGIMQISPLTTKLLSFAFWQQRSSPWDTPEKMGGGVRPASQNPYPVYDQNLWYSLPYFIWPDQNFEALFMTWSLNQNRFWFKNQI